MVNIFIFSSCISLNNQLWMTKPTLIDLNLGEYKRRLRYCPFMLNLDRCNGSGNTPGDQSSRICVPKKAADVNVFF